MTLWTSNEQIASVLQSMAQERDAKRLALGQRIAELRDARKWSQETLAQHLGISTSTVSRWERGITEGQPANIHALAEVFEVPVSEIVGEWEPHDLFGQLDRIEATVNEIRELLTAPASAARVAAAAGARAVEAAESPQTQASAPSRSQRAARRRKSA